MSNGDMGKNTDDPLRILIISQMFPSKTRPMYGTFVRDKALALKALGADVSVFVPEAKILFPFSLLKRYRFKLNVNNYRDLLKTERVNWITLPGRHLEALLRRFAWIKLEQVIKKIYRDKLPDLLYANDLFPDGYASSFTAVKYKIPLVVTTHGSDNRVHIKHPARMKALRNAFSKSSKVICVSSFVKEELSKYGLEREKMEVIYNGVDLEREYNGVMIGEIRSQYNQRMIILSVGHMVHFVKGFDVTISAFAKLINSTEKFKDAVLLLIGDGVEKESLEILAKKLNVEKSVFFLGAMEPEKTMAYMAAADVFCMPSWYEAFGVVYLEAMLHAKPIIAVEGQGISEIVENGVSALLVPPRDIDKTAEALKRLIEDKDYRVKIGKTAQALVKEKYSQKNSALKTFDLFERVIYPTR